MAGRTLCAHSRSVSKKHEPTWDKKKTLPQRACYTLLILGRNLELSEKYAEKTIINCKALQHFSEPLFHIVGDKPLLSTLFLALTEASCLSVDVLFQTAGHIVHTLTHYPADPSSLQLIKNILFQVAFGYTNDANILSFWGDLWPNNKDFHLNIINSFVPGQRGLFFNIHKHLYQFNHISNDALGCLTVFTQTQTDKSIGERLDRQIIEAFTAINKHYCKQIAKQYKKHTFSTSCLIKEQDTISNQETLPYLKIILQKRQSPEHTITLQYPLCGALNFPFDQEDISSLQPVLYSFLHSTEHNIKILNKALQFLTKVFHQLNKYLDHPTHACSANELMLTIATSNFMFSYWSEKLNSLCHKNSPSRKSALLSHEGPFLLDSTSHRNAFQYIERVLPLPSEQSFYFTTEGDNRVLEFYQSERQRPRTDTYIIRQLEHCALLLYVCQNLHNAEKIIFFKKIKENCLQTNTSYLNKAVFCLDTAYVKYKLSEMGGICHPDLCGRTPQATHCQAVAEFHELYPLFLANNPHFLSKLHLNVLQIIANHNLVPYESPFSLCRKTLCPSYIDNFSLANRANLKPFTPVSPNNYMQDKPKKLKDTLAMYLQTPKESLMINEIERSEIECLMTQAQIITTEVAAIPPTHRDESLLNSAPDSLSDEFEKFVYELTAAPPKKHARDESEDNELNPFYPEAKQIKWGERS